MNVKIIIIMAQAQIEDLNFASLFCIINSLMDVKVFLSVYKADYVVLFIPCKHYKP